MPLQVRTASARLVPERMADPVRIPSAERNQAERHIPAVRSLVDWDRIQTAYPAREDTHPTASAAAVPAWARPQEKRSAQHPEKSSERQPVLHSQKVAEQPATQEVRSSDSAQRPSCRIADTFPFCQRHYPGL